MVLTVGGVDGTVCYFGKVWHLFSMTDLPGGEKYSYIRAGLSHREAALYEF